ncbi:MATE family efflux transporter [Paraferrimonas sp. SM1919]|uniref:MATE family efflux transporter n=1 Tax=Paraferrimonas sp. SM1919 TaxID=2662263 RepID=UPI0013D2E3C5|nr:MATE family efflux transporter [Paraferrimonas sp. SM1919]
MAEAKFVSGSTMRHIVIMSATSAVGISALFLVDLLDLFFLSLLGEEELAAAVGYAGTISFFTTSVGIGLLIAAGALVSRAIGAKDVEGARRLFVNNTVLAIAIAIVVAALVYYFIPDLLTLMGAKGRTHELAVSYLEILIPSLPLICLGMMFGGALRALGDAKTSMNSTLLGGLVNAVFDPIFIFALSMGIEGAAVASVMARFTVMAYALHGIVIKHKLYTKFNWPHFVEDLRPIFAIAGPAIFTNIATPVGNAFVTREMAQFGDGYVAGWAIVGRLIPVAFGMIFALSGAIGPIIGQNFGAERFDRVSKTFNDALKFALYYVMAMSLIIYFLIDAIILGFDAKGDSASLIQFFGHFIAVTFFFSGALFVANASFNNLGKPKYSMFFNVGKATVGTVPFVIVGAQLWGAYGVLIGQAVGTFVFALFAVITAKRLVFKLESRHAVQTNSESEVISRSTSSQAGFSSAQSMMACQTEEEDCEGATRTNK